MNFNELEKLHTNLSIADDIITNFYNIEDSDERLSCKNMFRLNPSQHNTTFSKELCIRFGLHDSKERYDNVVLNNNVNRLDENIIAEYLLKYLNDNAFDIFYKVVKLMNSEFETAKAKVVDDLEQKIKDVNDWEAASF